MEYLKSFYSAYEGDSVVPIGNMNYGMGDGLGNGQIAMAICGNDVISNAITQGGMKRDDIAFVPFPPVPADIIPCSGNALYV